MGPLVLVGEGVLLQVPDALGVGWCRIAANALLFCYAINNAL